MLTGVVVGSTPPSSQSPHEIDSAASARSGGPSARATLALCAAILAAGALVRLLPCWNDFWLDEIWSWESARALTSPLGVFTEIHDTNNHHLNTLLIWALGDRDDWAIYRLPAFVAGVASVALAGWLAAQRGRLEAVFATLLCAACFALIHFSSEARGYSLMVFFALAALAASDRFERSGSRTAAAVFSACVVLGFLAQLFFVFFWAGVFVQGLWRALRRGGDAWRRLLTLHGLPSLLFAALWFVDLRYLEESGGPPADVPLLLARIFGFTLGLPIARELALPGALFTAVVLGLALAKLAREGDDAWLLHAIAIVIAPALGFGSLRPEVIELRYFLIGITLWLLLASFVLADAWRSGGVRRAVAAALVAVFVAGNAVHTAAFLRDGRGGFERALRYMAAHSSGSEVVVGSDHDFRNGTVLLFYARRLPPEKRLVYLPHRRWPLEGPEWLVVHAARRPAEPPALLELRSVRRYALAAEFDYAAISGFWWGIYRNLAAPGDPLPQRTRR